MAENFFKVKKGFLINTLKSIERNSIYFAKGELIMDDEFMANNEYLDPKQLFPDDILQNGNPQIQHRLDAFLGELFYLTEEQNQALNGLIPMTQEIFDSIMACRDGNDSEIMEALWTDVFLKYPEFALHHAQKLSEELGVPFDEEEFPQTVSAETKQSWERFRKLVKEKFGDDL